MLPFESIAGDETTYDPTTYLHFKLPVEVIARTANPASPI